MKLINVNCPNCSAVVEVDEYSKSFVCKYCGSTTIIEKDDFNTSYNDSRIEKAELYIRNQKDYKNATQIYKDITNSDPSDSRPWLGLLRCATCDFTQNLYLAIPGHEPIWLEGLEHRINKYYEKYSMLDKKSEFLASIEKSYNEYLTQNKSEYMKLLNEFDNENEIKKYNIVANEGESKYNETIKAENKIISFESLCEIFELMNFKLKKYMTIFEIEKEYNKELNYSEREYTFNDSGSRLSFDIDFYDNTRVSINNYDEFILTFHNRISEIKSLNVNFKLNYCIENQELGKTNCYIYQSIDISIDEKKLQIDVKLDSNDDKLNDVYFLIKNMVLTAPTKYDKVVKNRKFITGIVALGSGLIPAMILCSLLFLLPAIRDLYIKMHMIYPILCIILGMIIGKLFTTLILESKYEKIQPEKKYIGYDSETYKNIYGDDIESYINSSEILIGHNYKNMCFRNSILNIYSKCKKIALIELSIIILVTIILFFIG